MLRPVKQLLACVLVAAAAPALAAQLRNNGFETRDFTGWMAQGEFWRVSSWGKDSRRGVYGAVNDVVTNATDEYRVLAQELPARPGKVYTASVWLRTVCVENSESFLEVQFLSREGAVLSQFQSPRVMKDQAFTQMTTGPMTAPDKTDRVSVRGVVHLIGLPERDTDYHIFDDFDFRSLRGPTSGP